jgi:hypothetical protein
MFFLLAGAAVGLVLWLSWRARVLFELSVRDGRVLVVRGRVPTGYLHDVEAIVSRARVARGSVTAVRDERHARIVVSGDIDEACAQRLRNTFGLRPVSQLRAAPIIAKPTLGQVLGIAWLAWMLDRRV